MFANRNSSGIWEDCPEVLSACLYSSYTNISPLCSSTVIDTLHSREEPLAFFYFDTNNSGQCTVTQLLYSLVSQLSVQAPSADRTLSGLWSSYASGQHLPSDSALISKALIPILKEFTDPVYIVLDALDECSDRDKLLQTLIEIVDTTLPHVHLLLTSRQEVPCSIIPNVVSLSLEGRVDQDIDSYVTDMLSKKVSWSSERRDEIKRGLLEHGSGMFRLVSLQLKELRHCGTPSQAQKALLNMPTSLYSIYDRILQNIKNLDMVSSVGRVINWLLFSKRIMQLNEIIDALAFNFDQQPLCFDADERMERKALLEACAGFVTVSETTDQYSTAPLITLKLAHASVKDYFLSAKGPTRLCGDCEVSEQTAHHLIAQTCVAYLCSLDHVLDQNEIQDYPLAQYAAENWVSHVTMSFNFSQQCRRYGNALEAASSEGHIEIICLLLKHNFDVNAHSGFYGTALQAASSRGHFEIVRLLLEHGAEVNAQGGKYGNALQAASLEGHINIVYMLLEHGAEVNAQGGEYDNALQAASFGGYIKIVHLLLEQGAKVDAQGGRYGNVLQAACHWGHTKIVQLLLTQNANVNAQGGMYANALQAVSFRGYTKIFHLLLAHGAKVNAQGGEYDDLLQTAYCNGYMGIVHLLLEHGAEVNAQDGC
ncbi:ankyrin repeat-containing domain protein [Mycena epipterygia]|nr:ankyrin repeat-containing domain protein [Mycena epipterygia]